MWFDYLENTKFLHMLYKEVPVLERVRISNISIHDSGNRITIVFDMPKYADNPPGKWRGCNTVSVEVDFYCIKKIEMNSLSRSYIGDIDIKRDSNDLFKLNINGNILLNAIIPEKGYIQRISAYVLE